MSAQGRPAAGADLSLTARRHLRAAQDNLAERGRSELTMTAISQVTGLDRALVFYRFGGKAGLLMALVETLFQNPEVGLVGEIASGRHGAERVEAFLDWQRRVSARDRANRMLYELLPHALREPEVRTRFAEEYRVCRDVDAECLGPRRASWALRNSRPWPQSPSPWSRASASSARWIRTASTTSAPGGWGAR